MLGVNGSRSYPAGNDLGNRIGQAMMTVEPGQFLSVGQIATLMGAHTACGAISARLNTRAWHCSDAQYPPYVLPCRRYGVLGAVRIEA